MNLKLLGFVAVAPLVLAAGPASATVVFADLYDSADAYTYAYAGVTGSSASYGYGNGDYGYAYNLTDALGGVESDGIAGSLSKKGAAIASSSDNVADTYAQLTDSTSGTISFSSTTSATVKHDPSGYAYAYSYGYVYYYFDLTTAATVKLSWNNDDSITSGYYYTHVSDYSQDYYNYIPSGPQIGSVSYKLGAGSSYIYIYEENPDYVSQSGNGATSGGADGNFAFTITGVPETSTWVMLMAGFGLLGFAGYRRSKTSSYQIA